MTDVLIIEDEEILRDSMALTLQETGLTVATASDGRSGIAAFRRNPARVVITDLYLPEIDGLEVLTTLKREYPTVPVILMSGGGQYENLLPLEMAPYLGALATLTKPFGMEELLTALKAAFDD
jgi:DNA-binding NtrC family response regulator